MLSNQVDLTEKQSQLEFLKNYDIIVENIEKAAKERKSNELRKIGYKYLNLGRHMALCNRIQFELYPAFQGSKGEEEIGKILKELLFISKQNVEYKLQKTSGAESRQDNRPPYWNPSKEVNYEEKSIKFVHGGGLQYILGFLKGEESGYFLEEVNGIVGKGIQVHPYLNNEVAIGVMKRVNTYASDRAARSLDYPVRFFGEIQAQYLDSAPNVYEAGIRNCYVEKIKNIRIEHICNDVPQELLDEASRIMKSSACDLKLVVNENLRSKKEDETSRKEVVLPYYNATKEKEQKIGDKIELQKNITTMERRI